MCGWAWLGSKLAVASANAEKELELPKH